MAMYHSWDSQNAWQRQIHASNHLYLHHETAARLGIADDDWVRITSHHGRVKGQARLMDGVNRDTVWTWNAIGKRAGAWNLAADAPESTKGFLLNHTSYGLLGLLGGLGALGRLPAEWGFALAALTLALALISAGLLASAGHLGHPERAWRALSQWRSSWLSREGVLAVVTYAVAGLFALAWLLLRGCRAGAGGRRHGRDVRAHGGLHGDDLCLAQARAPVAQWLGAAQLSGAGFRFGRGLALCPGHALGRSGDVHAPFAGLALVVAWTLTLIYWRAIDGGAGASDAGSATGLGGFGTVRLLDPPHTEENYLQHEMGFRIARKHAGRLRRIAQGAAFAAPLVLVMLGTVTPAWLAAALGVVAALVMTAGLLIERWLFFAEATHTVTLYYGAGSA